MYCATPVKLENLCSAGTTAQAFPDIDNRPKSQDSIDALNALISNILEPIRLHYGHLTITHGFTSRALVNRVPSGVAKHLDQHCSHEINGRGKRICHRNGASADFYVPSVAAIELVAYVFDHLPFDRIYYYGVENPIHISYVEGDNAGQMIQMLERNGRRTPRVITDIPKFLNEIFSTGYSS